MIDQLRFRSTPFGKKGLTTKFPRDPQSNAESDPGLSDSSFPSDPGPDHAPAIIDDTAAILYAMLQRATLTLSAHTLTETTEAQGERYTFRSTKMSAALHAFLRIGRELRAWMRLRPAPTTAAEESSKFDDDLDRPEVNEQGYQQFYDHMGNKIGLPSLMHPFLHELDAAVEHLKQHGIKLPPPERPKRE